jgi:bud site selection protein 20
MGGSQRRKGMKGKNKGVHRALKTKHYLRDHDQIHDDLKNPQKYGVMEIDEAKPGSGQHYCIGCARYFESVETLKVHEGTKKHKRMVKKMLDKPYTH